MELSCSLDCLKEQKDRHQINRKEANMEAITTVENTEIIKTGEPQSANAPETIQAFSILNFICHMLFHPHDFFQHVFSQEKRRVLLFSVIWLTGTVMVMNSYMDQEAITSKNTLANWPALWLASIIAGPIWGVFVYWMGGALYNLRVRLSGGSRDYAAARQINIYSYLPVAIVTIGFYCAYNGIYGDTYFTTDPSAFLDIAFALCIIAAIVWSLIISFKGARIVHAAKPMRTAIFFLVLPGLAYFSYFSFIVADSVKSKIHIKDANQLAFQEMKQGNYLQAEHLFNEALRNPSITAHQSVTLLSNLGMLYANKGMYKDAINTYKRAQAFTAVGSAEYFALSGQLKILESRDIRSAVADFERSLYVQPDDFASHNILGLIYMGVLGKDMVDLKKALFHNSRAVELSPRDEASHFNLGLNYYYLGRYSDAVSELEVLQRANPDEAQYKTYLGLCYLQAGDESRAKMLLADAVKIDPSWVKKTVRTELGIE